MSFKWKSKSNPSKNSSKGSEMSDKSFQLSRNRFVSVSEFRNQIRVDIREYYYDDSGDRKPGKKGINLSLEEWNKFKQFVPKIEKAVRGVEDGSDPDSDEDKRKHKSHKLDSESDDDSDNGPKKPKMAKKSSDNDSDESDKKNKRSNKSKEVVSDSDSSD